jgi:hypothetical protein
LYTLLDGIVCLSQHRRSSEAWNPVLNARHRAPNPDHGIS